MAKAKARSKQSERLSNQIYALLKADLHAGVFGSGERLVEVDLAEKYNVSRTPVHAALVQLERDGLVVSVERGFKTPRFTLSELFHRLEVKRLLELRIAERAAFEATPEGLQTFADSIENEKVANETGDASVFQGAYREANNNYLSLCHNNILRECLDFVESYFAIVTNIIHNNPDNRIITISQHESMLKALRSRDPYECRKVREYQLDFITRHYETHPPGELG